MVHTRDGVYPAGFLAKEVSSLLGLDFVEMLARQGKKRRHHPMASLEQKPYVIIKRPATVTLIIDDMATSGNTMRLSLQALRDINVPAFGFVWVGH